MNQLKLVKQKKKDNKKKSKNILKKDIFEIYDEDNIQMAPINDEDNNIEKLGQEFLYDCDIYLNTKTLNKDINITDNFLIKNFIFNKYKKFFPNYEDDDYKINVS